MTLDWSIATNNQIMLFDHYCCIQTLIFLYLFIHFWPFFSIFVGSILWSRSIKWHFLEKRSHYWLLNQPIISEIHHSNVTDHEKIKKTNLSNKIFVASEFSIEKLYSSMKLKKHFETFEIYDEIKMNCIWLCAKRYTHRSFAN